MAESLPDGAVAVGGQPIVTSSPYGRRDLSAVATRDAIEVRDLLEIVAEARE
jgi:hypothetical protein